MRLYLGNLTLEPSTQPPLDARHWRRAGLVFYMLNNWLVWCWNVAVLELAAVPPHDKSRFPQNVNMARLITYGTPHLHPYTDTGGTQTDSVECYAVLCCMLTTVLFSDFPFNCFVGFYCEAQGISKTLFYKYQQRSKQFNELYVDYIKVVKR